MSKKLEAKQRRREAEEARAKEERRGKLRRNLLTIGVTLILSVIVIIGILSERKRVTGPAEAFGASMAEAGCGDVESPEELEAEHIDDGSVYEEYNSTPPTSGPHWQTPAAAGFFAETQPLSQVVHNLEHGQIVVYYQDLDDELSTQLEAYVGDSQGAILAHPAPEGVDGQMVMTAWTQLQTCDQISSAALDSFRKRFQGKAPEQLTPPFDG